MKSHANFQALGTVVTNRHEFRKLNENFNVPIRWHEVSISSEQDSFTFSDIFLGNSPMQTNLIYLLIKTSAEYLHFKSTTGRAYQLGRLERLNFSKMDVKDVLWENLNPRDVFSRLQILEFAFCCNLTSISWVVHLPCLQELRVSICPGLKQLINEEYVVTIYDEFDVSYLTFPSLKRMYLFNLYLESICSKKITFPALETMRVEGCERLMKLPFEADNIPSKLRLIKGDKEWWDDIDWEDTSLKSSVQPFFLSIKYNHPF